MADYVMPFEPGDGVTHELHYFYFADGFARNKGGVCAYCLGDPCNEKAPVTSRISEFYRHNPTAQTCPMCNGKQS